ncbi:hypothetical protein [Tenuibacillus multivorans]|uniref:Uncharacterized protein n=1 Tax=Tenuibacillus multivorans TaxID=237069 RepID=A0A1H0B348_9BACI|nr:hypothetical protein [Tenuibacillus multivorans]GEL77550.1 hypothetical protein TMU01_17850 [Tenuibacillus multivorans]SDN40078.1 hypothetical protein SAMN05216498_2198 [Tenuibacillus multivorans]
MHNSNYELNSYTIPYYYYPWYDIYHMYNQQYTPRQDYPEVDPSLFKKSAESFRGLLNEASGMLYNLSQDEKLAHDVMMAAQKNELDEVKKLLESTDISSRVDVDYNPDGITMKMSSQVEGTDCCHLKMDLRW